jgi:hypothetical protein
VEHVLVAEGEQLALRDVAVAIEVRRAPIRSHVFSPIAMPMADQTSVAFDRNRETQPALDRMTFSEVPDFGRSLFDVDHR